MVVADVVDVVVVDVALLVELDVVVEVLDELDVVDVLEASVVVVVVALDVVVEVELLVGSEVVVDVVVPPEVGGTGGVVDELVVLGPVVPIGIVVSAGSPLLELVQAASDRQETLEKRLTAKRLFLLNIEIMTRAKDRWTQPVVTSAMARANTPNARIPYIPSRPPPRSRESPSRQGLQSQRIFPAVLDRRLDPWHTLGGARPHRATHLTAIRRSGGETTLLHRPGPVPRRPLGWIARLLVAR